MKEIQNTGGMYSLTVVSMLWLACVLLYHHRHSVAVCIWMFAITVTAYVLVCHVWLYCSYMCVIAALVIAVAMGHVWLLMLHMSIRIDFKNNPIKRSVLQHYSKRIKYTLLKNIYQYGYITWYQYVFAAACMIYCMRELLLSNHVCICCICVFATFMNCCWGSTCVFGACVCLLHVWLLSSMYAFATCDMDGVAIL